MQVTRKNNNRSSSITARMLDAASPLIEAGFCVIAALPFAAFACFLRIW